MERRRFSESFDYPTLWGFESESQMYEHIWNSRPHVSFISGAPITSPSPINFAHVLPKALNRYPLFRLNPDNVILVLWEEHNLIDEGTDDRRKAYCKRVGAADFAAFELLKTKLLEEYERMISYEK